MNQVLPQAGRLRAGLSLAGAVHQRLHAGMCLIALIAALSVGAVLSVPTAFIASPAFPVPHGQAAEPQVLSEAPLAAEAPVTSTAGLEPSRSRPPQFVVLSFDGAGSVDLWQHWRDVARRDNAHFTYFLSGAYLLTRASAALYQPPKHRAGASDIGNLPTPAGIDPSRYMAGLLEQISAGFREGNEIGTHFNGHFCTPGANNVGTWDATDWAAELNQFFTLLANVNQNNHLAPPTTLPFGAWEVVGERTPCLQGNLTTLYPLLAQRGFRYDASQTTIEGRWPQRHDGIWSFPLALIPMAGRAIHVLSMDYNVFYNQTQARDIPAALAPTLEPALEDQTYNTFMGYFNRAYTSNRAPVILGAHFERWNSAAYLNALTRTIDATCTQPDVHCVSFKELADWLDAQTPAGLAALHAGSQTAVLASPGPAGPGPAE